MPFERTEHMHPGRASARAEFMDNFWQNARKREQINNILKELIELWRALVLLEAGAREEEHFQRIPILQRSLQALLDHFCAEFG